MATIPTTTVRIDPEVKRQATAVFDELGIGMSAAINAFLKAVIREDGMPFELKLETITEPLNDSRNSMLTNAFKARKDEFYTQYEDIELEMQNYTEYFAGKVILCNSDDPFESAFFRYFTLNFNELQLKRLIATSYAGSPVAGREYPLEHPNRAYKATINEIPDEILIRPDGSIDLERIFAIPGNSFLPLEDDGDFRSSECRSILKAADIVATNPPFSLFRDFVQTLTSFKKDFIILGNMNAATYKEIFPLFRENKIWYGQSIRSGDRKFYVPDDYPLNAAGCGIDSNGRHFIRVKGVRWFTNIDNGRRHEPLKLEATYDSKRNPQYENYSAIEVSRTAHIPFDYYGFIGVPITFLDRYSPDQFEIIMLANGNARTNVDSKTLEMVGYKQHPSDRGGVGIISGRRAYARILVRRKDV